jgi:CheY-like chemotaxis protein
MPPVNPVADHPGTILVVDDELMLRQLLSQVLSDAGFAVLALLLPCPAACCRG